MSLFFISWGSVMTILSKIGHVLTTELSKDLLFKKKDNVSDEYPFLENLRKRRSIYHLGKKVPYQKDELIQLIKETVSCCPSVQNSQSARVVILIQQSHEQFWTMVKDIQRQHMHEKAYEGVALKIDQCCAAYGTVLFFEDQQVLQKLQKLKPLQAEEFEIWSEQSSGMVQFAVWALFASLGLGAALHHYNPSINIQVIEKYNLSQHWQLKAQMTFGSILSPADEKICVEADETFLVFS